MDGCGLDGHTDGDPMPIAWSRLLHRWLAGDGPASPPTGGTMSATEELFREDGYLQDCAATVVQSDAAGIRLDRTVLYPMGGGQPGDSGVLRRVDGSTIIIADTRKGAAPGEILHVPAAPV